MKSYIKKDIISQTIKCICLLTICYVYYYTLFVLSSRNIEEIYNHFKTNSDINKVYLNNLNQFKQIKSELTNLAMFDKEIKSFKDEYIANITFNSKKEFASERRLLRNFTYLNKTFEISDILNNKVIYKINVGDLRIIETFSSLSLEIIKIFSEDKFSSINELYYGNVCQLFYRSTTLDPLSESVCSKFWYGILTKGINEGLSHLSNTLISMNDVIVQLNQGRMTIQEFNKQLDFLYYEEFMEIYVYLAFTKTDSYFKEILQRKTANLKISLLYLMIAFQVIFTVAYLVVILLVKNLKHTFKSLINYMVILPIKYCFDDKDLVKIFVELEDFMIL